MEPSSSDLRYFLEIARTKNISAAATSLGISQPSLTLAIQRLERFLGEKLLIRGRKGTNPTTAGRTLLANSKRLLEVWDDVRLKIHNAELDLSTRVIIGCHPEVAIDSLPLFLPELLETYPKLELTLVHDLSRKITEKVIASEIDLGLVVNPKRHPDLVIQRLATDEANLWVGPGSRAIQSPTSGKAILFCDTDLAQSQTLIKRAGKKGVKFAQIIHTSDLEVVSSVIASGAGIGVLPSEAALRNPSLKLKLIPGIQGCADEVTLIARYENRKSKAIEAISSAILREHSRKYVGVSCKF